MSSLYEYYNVGDDLGWACYGLKWYCQTFTPVIAHSIVEIKLKLWREGTPNNGTLSIFETDDIWGEPEGDALIDITVNGNTLTTDSGGAWYSYSCEELPLQAGKKYALVLRFPDGDSSNYVIWRVDSTNATYPRGCVLQSTNGGASWVDKDTQDFMFEDWGVTPVYYHPHLYVLELHNASDEKLVSVLENAHGIAYERGTNQPSALFFDIPSDDTKAADLTRAYELWLRKYDTGELVERFRLGKREDRRA